MPARPQVSAPVFRSIRGVLAAGLAAGLGLAGGWGCGGFHSPTLPPPSIESFTVANGSVTGTSVNLTSGGSATLTATFRNGLGMVGPNVGPIASGGKVTVAPVATTTYTLTVTASGLPAATAQVTVVVVPPPAPFTVTYPDPGTVKGGASATATVATPQDGCSYHWTNDNGAPAEGEGTSFTFTAGPYGLMSLTCTETNSAGTSLAGPPSPQYRLGGPAIFSFQAVPAALTQAAPPAPATLAFDFSFDDSGNAAATGTAVISTAAGVVADVSGQAGQSQVLTVQPAASTTYTLTVTDSKGQVAEATATVQVVPAPTITRFSALPPVIGPGGSVVLSAQVQDADGGTAVVDQGVGALPAMESLTVGPLEKSTTFTLTVSNLAGASVTAQAVVRVGNLTLLAGAPSGEGSASGTAAAGWSSANPTDAGARFLEPAGVVLGGTVDHPLLFIADTAGQVIRALDLSSGTASVLAGLEGVPGTEGEGAEAQFDHPLGLALVPGTGAAAGDLLVADRDNHAICLITPTGKVITVAGTPGSPGAAEGTGEFAQFRSPEGVACNDDGSLWYVADTGNGAIRQIDASALADPEAQVGPSQVTVSTLAGTAGQLGGLDGAGPAARFLGPTGLAWDTLTKSLFVADTPNHSVRQVAADGTVVTVAGSLAPTGAGSQLGVAPAAPFNAPRGVAVDAAGGVYVADTGNARICTLALDNGLAAGAGGNEDVELLAGAGLAAAGPYLAPVGLAAPSAPDTQAVTVYAADDGGQTIRRITGGTEVVLAGKERQPGDLNNPNAGQGASARFHHPQGLVLGAGGTLYLADTANNVVRAITPSGIVSTWATGFSGPTGLAQDGQGGLLVADTGNDVIRRIDASGNVTLVAGTVGAAGSDDTGSGQPVTFDRPTGVAVDAQGNILVADQGNNVIRRIAPNGTVTTLAGTAGVTGAENGALGPGVSFDRPSALAVDPKSSAIFVADYGNDLVRVIRDGSVNTLAGLTLQPGDQDGDPSLATLNGPWSLALDGAGTLYVAEAGGSVVRTIASWGEVSTIIGRAGASGIPQAGLPFALPGGIPPPGGIAVNAATGVLFLAVDDAVLTTAYQ